MFNREQYIGDAIDSILNQSFTDFEIIVVDDASTDASAERVAAYADPRIRVSANKTNQGIAASRNHGIAEAKGDYVAFLDSDDHATPERLIHQVTFLDANPDHAAVGGWMRWINDVGEDTGKTKRKATGGRQIAAESLFRCGLENTTAMARADVLRAYPHRENIRFGSDYDLWARIGATHKLAALPEIVAYRRRHDSQATHEQQQAIKADRLSIFANQLTRLGVDFSDTDLERHYLLRRLHKMQYTPDAEFLDWAESWLNKIKAANQQNKIYPEPEFSAVLALFWAKACWNVNGRLKTTAARRFIRSPLRRGILSGLLAETSTRLRLST